MKVFIMKSGPTDGHIYIPSRKKTFSVSGFVFVMLHVIGSGPLDGSSTVNVYKAPVAVSSIYIFLLKSGKVGGWNSIVYAY